MKAVIDKPIFLIGFMGSGKTTMGKKLANRLERKFVDLDHIIVDRTGMSIPEYFKLHGEAKFRELEREVLMEQQDPQTVVSTGGGSPCYFDSMDWILDNGLALYLHLTPKALYMRLRQSDISKRPALKGFTGDELLAFIEEKLAGREPFYNRAHIKIDHLNSNANNICQIIEAHVKSTQPQENKGDE